MTEPRRGDRPARDGRPTGRRGRVSTVAVALVVAATAGCSGGGRGGDDGTGAADAAAAPDVTVVEIAATPDTSAVTTVEPTAAPPATVAIDAAAMLQQALDSVAAGYHFRTVVTVAGAEVLVAEGDRVGDGTRLTIWSSGTSVAYVITPAGSWVFPEGGEWEALDSAPATTDPLLALRTPTTVSGTSTDGTSAALAAVVPAASLGVPSDGTAEVAVNVAGGTLVDVTYDAALDGQTASVRSTFSPVQDATPVAAPI